MNWLVYTLIGVIVGGLVGWYIHQPEVVVKACPVSALPNGDVSPMMERGQTVGEAVSTSAPISCSECLPRCSSQLDSYLDIYLKVRGIGTTVALREGMK